MSHHSRAVVVASDFVAAIKEVTGSSTILSKAKELVGVVEKGNGNAAATAATGKISLWL
jgi:hypothetical protein